MKTRDFHKQGLLSIFLSYFKPHMGLFILDMACALMISIIDLAFPYVSRICMYELIPESRYKAFFAVVVYRDESGQPAGKPVFFFGQGGEPAAQHTPQTHGGQHNLQVGLPQVKTVDVAAYVIDERALSCHESRF